MIASIEDEMNGRIESVNVGGIREVEWRGQVYRTGIYKSPVEGPVRVEGVQMAGDEQADLTVHGGPTKSVYGYPVEHYEKWRVELPEEQRAFVDEPGAFGENLTMSGLLESDVGIGDRFRIGSAILVVTEPRMPCSKLAMRFRDPMMIRRFTASGRHGWYFGIEEPGEIRAGDTVERIEAHPERLTIAEVVGLRVGHLEDEAVRALAARHPGLPSGWRDTFAKGQG